MSTLITTNLKNPSSGSNNLVLAVDGTVGITTLKHPSSATNNLTLNSDGTVGVTTISGVIQRGTAVASTSGTSIDFTSIPSWVKRITVMFNGVSLSGSAAIAVQIGSGSFTTSGYISNSSYVSHQTTNTTSGTSYTSGFAVVASNASSVSYGSMIIQLLTGNTYVSTHVTSTGAAGLGACVFGSGSVALTGVLDRVRITSSGVDTFDAGTINILYEG